MKTAMKINFKNSHLEKFVDAASGYKLIFWPVYTICMLVEYKNN